MHEGLHLVFIQKLEIVLKGKEPLKAQADTGRRHTSGLPFRGLLGAIPGAAPNQSL